MPEAWEANIETMKAEMRKELKLMPNPILAEMVSMVMEEVQTRAPKSEIIEIRDSADKGNVRRLVEAFRLAFEKEKDAIITDGGDVKLLDAMMATVNFVRMIQEANERLANIESLEEKKRLRMIVVATVERTLIRRVMN